MKNNLKNSKNICILGISKREETQAEGIFEEIMAENFPNLGKETHIQVQEAQKAPNKMSPRRPTARHAVIKMAKVKNKDAS